MNKVTRYITNSHRGGKRHEQQFIKKDIKVPINI